MYLMPSPFHSIYLIHGSSQPRMCIDVSTRILYVTFYTLKPLVPHASNSVLNGDIVHVPTSHLHLLAVRQRPVRYIACCLYPSPTFRAVLTSVLSASLFRIPKVSDLSWTRASLLHHIRVHSIPHPSLRYTRTSPTSSV